MIFHLTSRKPVLVIGNGARSAEISDLIYDFINKTHIPVLTSMNTVDMVQDKYRIGFIGTYGNRVSNMILNECDLVISVGARLGLRQIGHKKELFAPKAKLIRCDVDQYELAGEVKLDEEDYNFDAKVFMEMLLQGNIPDYSEWWNKCHEAKKILDGYDDTDGNKLVDKIAQLLPENPIVTVDIGQTVCWTTQSMWLKGTEGRIIIGGSYGAMGVGLPYAIGASISNNNGITYCITGDGGLQMNIQELETVKRENLPIKILVVNNKELGKISEIQHGSYDDRFYNSSKYGNVSGITTGRRGISKERLMLGINIISLAVSAVLCVVGAFVIGDIVAVALAMTAAIVFRSVIANIFLAKQMEISVDRNVIWEVMLAILFILLNAYFSDVIIFAVYGIIYGAYLCVNKKEVSELGKIVKRKILH